MYELTSPFEEMFQAVHEHSEPFSLVVLGSEDYARKIKMPKWNIPVCMLDEPAVALKMIGKWDISTSRSFHSDQADKFSRLEQDAINAIGRLQKQASHDNPQEHPWNFISGGQ